MENGRPKKEFNVEQLGKLAEFDLSLEELAAFFDCSKSTIQRRLKESEYAEAFERGKQLGNISLKRKMWQKALEGNTTMLIWLSKNRLGFSDKQEFKPIGTSDQPTVTIVIESEEESKKRLNKLENKEIEIMKQ